MTSPNGARLEVVLLIDTDKYDEAVRQGYSDVELEKAIAASITTRRDIPGPLTTSPVLDIESVTLQKYY